MKQSLKTLPELTLPLVTPIEDGEKSYYSCPQTHRRFYVVICHAGSVYAPENHIQVIWQSVKALLKTLEVSIWVIYFYKLEEENLQSWERWG